MGVLVIGRHYWSGLLRKRISLFGCGGREGGRGGLTFSVPSQQSPPRLKDSASHLQLG